MNLRRWLEARWYSSRAPLLLRPLAALYGLLLAARGWCYRRGLLATTQVGVPVIVVGNLTVGGTGKTPLAAWLAQQLGISGWRAGIVTRGHGGSHAARAGAARLVAAGDLPAEVGDEALLLVREAHCPVAIGVRRAEAARLLVAQGCQVIIADDGLQHLALRRNVEIVVVDGGRMFGNGALLPAGPLREPVARLAGVDAVVLNGDLRSSLPVSAARSYHMHLQPQRMISLVTGAASELPQWRDRPVHAVAGTGNPGRFFAALRSVGVCPVEHVFADHHLYRAGDLAFGDELEIVMTAKDAVKCAAFATDRMWYLDATVQFERDDAARLLQWLGGYLAGKA